MIQNRWIVPSERPEVYPEETCGEKVKKTNRNDQRFDYQKSSQPNLRPHDIVTGDNESPIESPEFLTGRMPSRNHLHSSHDDFNTLFDTTELPDFLEELNKGKKAFGATPKR